MADELRVGIVGLGDNCRLRHVPGLLASDDVIITGVCNRRPDSTAKAAEEFGIAKTYSAWQELIADDDIDAIVIGTWPYLHCDITVAGLEAGKHVLTEARMAMNAEEAHRMRAASAARPELITQIVPSPLGLKAHQVLLKMLSDGYIGELREFVVLGCNDAYCDAKTPLHWRQSAEYSGVNMLALGIQHEPLIRWIADPVSVLAQTQTFTATRPLPEGGSGPVGTPDSVQVLTRLPNGAQGVYHLSSGVHFGPSMQAHLYGSEGTIKYLVAPEDQLFAARAGDSELQEVEIPEPLQLGWRVEEEFVNAIRGIEPIVFNTFDVGVRYMEFTEAVARSAATGLAVELPLNGAN